MPCAAVLYAAPFVPTKLLLCILKVVYTVIEFAKPHSNKPLRGIIISRAPPWLQQGRKLVMDRSLPRTSNAANAARPDLQVEPPPQAAEKAAACMKSQYQNRVCHGVLGSKGGVPSKTRHAHTWRLQAHCRDGAAVCPVPLNNTVQSRVSGPAP